MGETEVNTHSEEGREMRERGRTILITILRAEGRREKEMERHR